MTKIQILNNILTTLFIAVFLVSCNDNIEFNQYKTLKGLGWKANDTIQFNFLVTDTIVPKNLFLNLRNNNNYQFSNLFVITELVFPNKTKIIDTLQYQMANEKGVFLGEGFTEIKENKLYYKQNKVFPMVGEYEFKVRQSIRKNGEVYTIETLEGILDVGFSIEKIEQ